MADMLFDIPRPAPEPKNPTPDITNEPYKHSIVDSKKTPIETIASYIGGSNWAVDYYSQVFAKNEELKAFDPSQLNPYQNYKKINRLIIKLQGALSFDDDTETARIGLTGNAIMTPHPNLIPNVGDAFIADIGDGQAGQFTVSSIRKLSNNLATAWAIDFKLDRLVTKQLITLLNSKVTQELYYQRDYMITGQNALITSDDYQANKSLSAHLKKISYQFFTNHYSNEVNTLLVPDQTLPTYDPFVVRATLRIISGQDLTAMRNVREYNCDDHRIPDFTDIYSAVIRRDPTLLYNTFSEFACIYANTLVASVYQNTIRYSGINLVVIPKGGRPGTDDYTNLINLIEMTVSNSTNGGIDLNGPFSDADCGCGVTPEPEVDNEALGEPGMDIPKITNASYVLSKAFYEENIVGCTLFERMVWNILNDKPIDYHVIYQFAENYYRWGKLEQFYLGPLLILMIRYALRSM